MTVQVYECVDAFLIPKVDDHGFTSDSDYITVAEGSMWHLPEEDGYRFIGGQVRLESADGDWIEISKETLSERFKGLGVTE